MHRAPQKLKDSRLRVFRRRHNRASCYTLPMARSAPRRLLLWIRLQIAPYCVRPVIFLLALFLSPVSAFAVSVPVGWRLPNVGDRTSEWQGAGAPFHIRGDFNGDGIADEAWILFRKRSNAWAVFVFLGAADGAVHAIKLTEELNAPAQRFVLETIRPSKINFRTACGKGYFTCAEGEPSTIQFHLASISFCLRESSCSVFVWQPQAARFQQIRMSD